MNARISPCVHTVSLVLNLSKRKRKWFNTNRKRNYLLKISINNIHFRLIHYQVPINKFDHHVLIDYPGRTCTIANDRLQRTTEIYRDRARLPYTTRVNGLIRRETDSVYGDRTKILSDWRGNICASYTELYDCRIRSYNAVRDRIRSYTAVATVQFNEQ
jgi:hypothetical protein